jgi:hypothetical protein
LYNNIIIVASLSYSHCCRTIVIVWNIRLFHQHLAKKNYLSAFFLPHSNVIIVISKYFFSLFWFVWTMKMILDNKSMTCILLLIPMSFCDSNWLSSPPPNSSYSMCHMDRIWYVCVIYSHWDDIFLSFFFEECLLLVIVILTKLSGKNSCSHHFF